MKATGMIRRIDDLGRIVIPREICHTMRIHKGDLVEIFVDNEGRILLQKYDDLYVAKDLLGELRREIETGPEGVRTEALSLIASLEDFLKEKHPKEGKKDYGY